MWLKGKIAVIAGDSFGIGRATAALFAHEGAHVVWVDNNGSSRGEESLRPGGSEVSFHRADLSKAAEVRAAAEACENTLARLDILFNVAGRTEKQSFEATTEAVWSAMIGSNLTSGFLCSKYFLPLMKRAKSGVIINHASIDGVLGNPALAAYSAAKGGVLPLTHVMAHDLAQYGIRVNSISTGGIRQAAATLSDGDRARIAVTPSARMGTPDDVAKVALFLASDLASYVNGANIVVDGGRTAITHGCYDD